MCGVSGSGLAFPELLRAPPLPLARRFCRGGGNGGVGDGGAAIFSSAACAFLRGSRPKGRLSAVVMGIQLLRCGVRLSQHAALLDDPSAEAVQYRPAARWGAGAPKLLPAECPRRIPI
eukprot:2711019-Alexandrium_andersonii.AAC.1